MRRLSIALLVLALFAALEIAVLVAVGQVIGVGWTLLLMLTTSALGAWLLRQVGPRAWRAFRADVQAGRPPGHSATDGLLVVLGAVFMLIPGFVSDLLGALLLIPVSRRLARRLVLHLFTTRISPATATSLFGPRRVRARQGTHRPATPSYPVQIDEPQPLEGEIIEPDKDR